MGCGASKAADVKAPKDDAKGVPQGGADESFDIDVKAEIEADHKKKSRGRRRSDFDMGQRKLGEFYDVGKMLGKGSIGRTLEGTSKMTGKKVAIKALPRSHPEFEYKTLMTEIEIMRKVDHPHCIKLHDVFEDEKLVYLVQDLATGGELFDRVVGSGSFSERDACFMIKQVIEACAYLHSIGICHRDLKPENVLMLSDDKDSPDYNTVKIADFGLSSLSAVEYQATMETACGTPEYLAPELVSMVANEDETEQTYSSKVDIWAIGVILYVMISGFHPFYTGNQAQLYDAIMKGQYSFPNPAFAKVSRETKDFISWVLVVNPAKRPSAEDLLKHPWVIKGSKSLKEEELGTATTLGEYNTKRQSRKSLRKVSMGVKAAARMSIAAKGMSD
uniref:Protein kinase domain-containing protein n=1 Tax=Hemiselmis tepida TaxID=464990 RepID=A0A7S0VZK5_9CRYP|mmetsp:Transcript_34707/g.88839  ORF Transcript_34707/g.88839 Transcript_34707/m.88839 type:complete len:389 (+) Transcript_34707:37-1203(+)